NVHVFCEHVGGGFGGKQEMLTEEICVLATMKTGRPVKLEFTREEEFVGAVTRHPMKVHVKLGARPDGPLTAMQVRLVSNTGAYGNHGSETLYHSCGESIGVYRCPNKRVDAYAVYTNMVPAGAMRGYGVSQTIFAVESAMDELARALEIDPFELRQRNVVRPGDPMVSASAEMSDIEMGSYGLDECLQYVRGALERGNDVAPPEGADWLLGQGMAMAMIDCAPPTEHRSEARIRLDANVGYDLAIGTAEFGNGTTTVHGQIAASALETTASRIRIAQSDTDRTGYDTGAFASTGTMIAGKAVELASEALCARILAFAAEHSGVPVEACRLEHDAVVCDGRRIELA